MLGIVIPVVTAAVTFGIGVWRGRRFSLIGTAAFCLLTLGAAIVCRQLLAQSGEPGWSYYAVNRAPLVVGHASLFGLIGFAGPALIKDPWNAFLFSGALVVGLLTFASIVLLALSCVLYGACV